MARLMSVAYTEQAVRDHNFVDAQGMQPTDDVTRIEWRYLDAADGMGARA